MFLFTVVPEEIIFEEEYDVPQTVEISKNQMKLVIEPIGFTKGRIVRIISTDPYQFMEPAVQPGQEIILSDGDWRLG
jgi:virulence-associated protein VagC